jgi:hypothetical protein
MDINSARRYVGQKVKDMDLGNLWKSIMPPEDLAKLGKQALASGAVSPEQAMSNIPKDALDGVKGMQAPGDDAAMVTDLSSPTAMLNMSAAPPAQGHKHIVPKGFLTLDEHTPKGAAILYKDKEQHDGFAPMEFTAPPVQAPKPVSYEPAPQPQFQLQDAVGQVQLPQMPSGTDVEGDNAGNPNGDLEKMMGLEAQSNANRNYMNWKPLAGLADNENAKIGLKTNLASSFPDPEKPGSMFNQALALQKMKDAKQIGMMNALARAKGTDAVMERLKIAKEGRDRAIDETNHRQLINKISADKGLQARANAYQSLSNAVAAVAQADNVPTAQLMELQQILRNAINLGSGSRSTGAERGETYIKALDIDADTLGAYLQSGVNNVEKTHAIVKHLLQLANIEMNNSRKQYQAKINSYKSAHKSTYDRRPDLNSDMDAFVADNLGQFPEMPVANPKDMAAPSYADTLNMGAKPKVSPPSMDKEKQGVIDRLEALRKERDELRKRVGK